MISPALYADETARGDLVFSVVPARLIRTTHNTFLWHAQLFVTFLPLPRRFITLRAKLSGVVYCNRSCLWVCLFMGVYVGVFVFVGLLPR